MPPMTVPRTAIIRGSMRLVRASVVASTSESSITVVNQGFNATTPTTDWCIALINSAGSGTKVWKYTGRGGLQSGAAAGCVAGTDY